MIVKFQTIALAAASFALVASLTACTGGEQTTPPAADTGAPTAPATDTAAPAAAPAPAGDTAAPAGGTTGTTP